MVVQIACVDEILGAQVAWFRWFWHRFLESYIAEVPYPNSVRGPVYLPLAYN